MVVEMQYSEDVWAELQRMNRDSPWNQHRQMLMSDFWKKSEEAFNVYWEAVREQHRKNEAAVIWWKMQRSSK